MTEPTENVAGYVLIEGNTSASPLFDLHRYQREEKSNDNSHLDVCDPKIIKKNNALDCYACSSCGGRTASGVYF